jgi:nitrogen-specific signal transduction histidine kinase
LERPFCSGSTAASNLIERLRALVRKRPIELRALDVNEVARDVLKLVRTDGMRRGVVLRAELAPSPIIVDADRVSLQQVIQSRRHRPGLAIARTIAEALEDIFELSTCRIVARSSA